MGCVGGAAADARGIGADGVGGVVALGVVGFGGWILLYWTSDDVTVAWAYVEQTAARLGVGSSSAQGF